MKIAIAATNLLVYHYHRQTHGQTDRYRYLFASLHVVAENMVRNVTDRHMGRQTDRQTDLQTKYRNPRCACSPRANISRNITLTVASFIMPTVYLVGIYISKRDDKYFVQSLSSFFCNNIYVF